MTTQRNKLHEPILQPEIWKVWFVLANPSHQERNEHAVNRVRKRQLQLDVLTSWQAVWFLEPEQSPRPYATLAQGAVAPRLYDSCMSSRKVLNLTSRSSHSP